MPHQIALNVLVGAEFHSAFGPLQVLSRDSLEGHRGADFGLFLLRVRITPEMDTRERFFRSLASIVERHGIDPPEGLALRLTSGAVLHDPHSAPALIDSQTEAGQGLVPYDNVWLAGWKSQRR